MDIDSAHYSPDKSPRHGHGHGHGDGGGRGCGLAWELSGRVGVRGSVGEWGDIIYSPAVQYQRTIIYSSPDTCMSSTSILLYSVNIHSPGASEKTRVQI